MESSDNFDPLGTFVGLIIWIISAFERYWLNLRVSEIYAKKLLSDPYVLFIVTAAMFFKRSKIQMVVSFMIP